MDTFQMTSYLLFVLVLLLSSVYSLPDKCDARPDPYPSCRHGTGGVLFCYECIADPPEKVRGGTEDTPVKNEATSQKYFVTDATRCNEGFDGTDTGHYRYRGSGKQPYPVVEKEYPIGSGDWITAFHKYSRIASNPCEAAETYGLCRYQIDCASIAVPKSREVRSEALEDVALLPLHSRERATHGGATGATGTAHGTIHGGRQRGAVARKEYLNLLSDLEYDTDIVAARERRDERILQMERKRVLEAKHKMNNYRN